MLFGRRRSKISGIISASVTEHAKHALEHPHKYTRAQSREAIFQRAIRALHLAKIGVPKNLKQLVDEAAVQYREPQ